jgi:hypothetical protein
MWMVYSSSLSKGRSVSDHDPMTILRYFLLVDDLDDSRQSSVCASMTYLRIDVFPSTEPFSSWSEGNRMRTAIEAISSLGHDGLAEFWSESLDDYAKWIRSDLSMTEVDEALEVLTPIWWTGERPEDFQWGRTDEGEALFQKWVTQPPVKGV